MYTEWRRLLLPLLCFLVCRACRACLLDQIVDMFTAATYLAGALEPWVALIVFITIGSYIPLTIIVTEWRGNFRREMNRTENARSARVTDALLNWCGGGGEGGRGRALSLVVTRECAVTGVNRVRGLSSQVPA